MVEADPNAGIVTMLRSDTANTRSWRLLEMPNDQSPVTLIINQHLVLASSSTNSPSMSSPNSSYLVIPPQWLKDPLPTREASSTVIPRVIKAVEALREWYHTVYHQADQQERNSRDTALRKIIVSPTEILHGDHNQNEHPGHVSTSHTHTTTVGRH